MVVKAGNLGTCSA